MVKNNSAARRPGPSGTLRMSDWRPGRGKCEGRKSHAERNPELVALAKRLHRQRPKGGRMSLRAISAELATQGFLNENGRPFAAASIKSMLHS